MRGQDIALLLKLATQGDPRPQSKGLAENLYISQSEVSKALKRCVDAGLLYTSGAEKRVKRSALMEFLKHGLKYTFPPARGSMVRGVPTATGAEPLKSRFLEDREPPPVWPHAQGKFVAFHSPLSTALRPKLRYEIPGSTVSSHFALRSTAEGRANETSQ